MNQILIKNARIINEGKIITSDIFIEDEIIQEISNSISVKSSEFLDKVMSNITLPGSVFLALIAVFPAFVVQFMDVQQGWALFFGGTSLLIMVGVAIDTMSQVNSYLLNREYDGLMKAGKNRKTGI